MGVTYEGAGPDVQKMVKATIAAYHPALSKVTVATVFCRRTDRHGTEFSAMKTRGQEVLAKIAITPLYDRARGMADAKLTINAYSWERLNENQKKALLDHELMHLKTGDGADDLGRPQLKMRHHDWEVTGFADVAKRHRESSIESMQVLHVKAEFWSQMELFGDAAN